MVDPRTIQTVFEYVHWSNERLLECAMPVEDARLDRDLEIGPGSLRRILMHTLNGERVWLARWQGQIETQWPSESGQVPVDEIARRFDTIARERERFLATLDLDATARVQTYRDSKGSLFTATLGDMLLQGALHSKHHQAQACNALRRLGAAWPELDYMMRVRRPA